MIDVIGLELDDARRRLSDAGLRVGAVVETRPPRVGVALSGALRVVRARRAPDGAVDLVVTHERYEPAAVPARGGSALPSRE